MITSTALLLSAAAARPAGVTDPDLQKTLIDNAGPIAMAFIVALGIAMFFLFRSMSRQIKKISPDLPAGPDDTAQAYDRELTQQAIERGRIEARGTDAPGGTPDTAVDDAPGQ
jgi:hypothetical protein